MNILAASQMKLTPKSATLQLFLVVAIFTLSLGLKGQGTTVPYEPAKVETPENRIAEEKFIQINGIEQWITVRGTRTKPIILFIHGGPGSPFSPYSDKLYKDLEKDFLIVQWDQRGTGKTFGKTAPDKLTGAYLQANPLTMEQMVDDGLKVSKYLLEQFDQKKIILFGTSWGSALAVNMVGQQPSFFHAYVGHSQIVNPKIDREFYDKINQIAINRNDTSTLNTLKSIGKPPYHEAKKVGQLFRIVKKYEKANSTPAPESWFVESSTYNNATDSQHRADGDDYSFVNYVGDSQLGVVAMSAKINLMKDHLLFKVPVFLIQGEEDLLTPKEKTKKYFDSLKAPEKNYYQLPKTAHGFNTAVLSIQKQIFNSIARTIENTEKR